MERLFEGASSKEAAQQQTAKGDNAELSQGSWDEQTPLVAAERAKPRVKFERSLWVKRRNKRQPQA